ncbi:hypothetical protein TPHA_0K00340 [Tetrapisispora phaffii CBS 4417]|uniref:Uncharacterized protein n=1 Tax=Tetrapisispora phaffii (strain ATCC 24235 / CBS 4417 / NBRC 1672 / NRRL Y-8282 / UCD 70-5) TaxID=1071381 RepID=G8BZ40_TETPH|nr:hypothetical protein TPHA_0K00340 [Tetrapisispora phaffii CBS 4417]CCE65168.1 hypothetical protein TPHA_0K00340 [Tetrapisispora phaffii CBS 4417]
MEFLALSAVKFVVWSSDHNLVASAFSINAHPKTTVARLLQYVHKQMECEGSPSDYMLLHEGKELSLDVLLQSVAIGTVSSFVRVAFEQRDGPEAVQHAASTVTVDFTSVSVNVIYNSFSMDKIHEFVIDDTILSKTSLRDLQQRVVANIGELEDTLNQRQSFCSKTHSHTLADCLALKWKGKQSYFLLNDNRQLTDSMSLQEALGIDFTPEDHAKFTVFIKLKHKYSPPALKSTAGKTHLHTLNFISTTHLFTDKMFITNTTTVNDVREFISCNYLEHLKTCRSEVKLIYKGRLLNSNDQNNEPTKILDALELQNNEYSAKVHVQISSSKLDLGAEFWEDMFIDPTDLSFNNSATEETSNTLSDATDPELQINNDNLVDTSVLKPTIKTQPAEDIIPSATEPLVIDESAITKSVDEYITESRGKLQSTGILYEKCVVDGQEVFIKHSKFETTTNKLVFDGEELLINEGDFFIHDGYISLSPRLIALLENKYNMEIRNESVDLKKHDNENIHLNGPIITDTTTFDDEEDEDNLFKTYTPSISTVLETLVVVLKTLYFIGMNGIAPLVFIYEFYLFLSLQVVFPIALFILFRIIWSTQEIWDLWIPYLRRHRVVTHKQQQEIQQFVRDHELETEFYLSCASNEQILEDLLVPELELQRFAMYASLNIVLNDTTVDDNSKTLRESITKMATDKHTSNALLESLFLSCISNFDPSVTDIDALELQYSVKEIIAYIGNYKNSKLLNDRLNIDGTSNVRENAPRRVPITIFVFRILINIYSALMNTDEYMNWLEAFVPYPGHDNILVQVVKNILLFFLVLIPPIKSVTDRAIEKHRENEEFIPNENIYVSSLDTVEVDSNTVATINTNEDQSSPLNDNSDQEEEQSIDVIEGINTWTEGISSGTQLNESSTVFVDNNNVDNDNL